MGLVLSLNVKRSKDGAKVYITDKTGVYSESNLGGYGDVNPLRASVALLLYPIYKPTTSAYEKVVFDGTLSPNFIIDYNLNHLDTYESAFTVLFPNDGWYEINLIALQTTVPNDLSYAYYDTVGGVVKIHNGSSWVAVSDIHEVLAKEALKKFTCHDLHISNNSVCMNKAWKKYIDCSATAKDCKICDKYKDQYFFRLAQANSAFASFVEGNRYEAQKIMEGLKQLECYEC